MNIIVVTGLLSASDSDVLNNTRLQTVPMGGMLTFEFQTSAFTAADQGAISLQMPNGDTPMNNQPIPAGVTSGSLNLNDKTQISQIVAQGGHTVFGVAITGTCDLVYRVTYTPA